MSCKHNKVPIQVGEQSGEYDEKIAPIIKALWEQGISVLDGCEEYRCEHYAMLFFENADDAGRFLEIMNTKSDDESIHIRIFHPEDDEEAWEVDACPGHFEGDDGVTFLMFVHFPISDIDSILSALSKD